MAGAIFFHLTTLGIEVQGDGGQLFIYALLVFVTSAALLYINRKKILTFLPFRKSLVGNKYSTH